MQKTTSESYKRLIRKLRKKKDEKYSIPKDNDAFLFEEESENSRPRCQLCSCKGN